MRLYGDIDIARSMVVTGSIVFELCLVFTCRSKQSLLRIGFFSNRYLLAAVAIAFTLLFLCVYSPINVFLRIVPLTLNQWILPFAWGIGTLLFFETLKLLLPKRRMTW